MSPLHNSNRSLLKHLNGMISVWKPVGQTSAQFVYQLRDKLCKEGSLAVSGRNGLRVGHGGTLDRGAEGVLAVGLGDGCQLLNQLLKGNKRYEAVGCLGISTDTGDTQGAITDKKPFDSISQESFTKALDRFIGEIHQVPPVYSALKYKGQRLADLARRGYDLPQMETKTRRVIVHSIKCLHFDPPYFTLDINCGGGFYVRSLIHDVGLALDSCAHMVSLKRTSHGPFTAEHVLPATHWTLEHTLHCIGQSKFILDQYANKETAS